MELLKVDTIEETLDKLDRFADQLPLHVEEVPHYRAIGRILAQDIFCQENVPAFCRSTMDGYAVRSSDTNGSSESIPSFLKIKGEVEMGKAPEGEAAYVGSGECVYVPTGAMIPEGADAVVMIEYCEEFSKDEIAVYTSVSYGNNMVFPGDDLLEDQLLLKRGRRLKPADIGVLSAAGYTLIKVYRPWKISVFSTGDEIIDPKQIPKPGQMRDVNTFALLAQAEQMGFEVVDYAVIEDQEDLLKSRVEAAMYSSDLIFISGGSSQGKKDVTAKIINELTSSGVLTHGIAVKPGKPTITGFDEGSKTAVIGLPGHPVAALLLFRILSGGLWDLAHGDKKMNVLNAGNSSLTDRGKVVCKISTNLAASPGRKTFQLVKIEYDKEDKVPWAVPVLGKSGLIRTMSEADGYMVMDVNDEGINGGEYVTVILL